MQLIENFDLSACNTMGLRSFASFGGTITHRDQIPSLVKWAGGTGRPLHVLGRGSNCLLRETIDATVAIMATSGRIIRKCSDGVRLVTAQAGEDWPDFVEWTVARGLGGLENLAGIPGTVGAAPVQNIGAYGVELADLFHSLTAYDTLEGRFRSFGPRDCQFSYRNSIFKKAGRRFIIADVTFALPEYWQPILDYAGLKSSAGFADPASVMETVLALRRSKLPDWRSLGNAGSFFHNPVVSASVDSRYPDVPGHRLENGMVKLSAAWLIEACGFKGYRRGPAGIHDGHALILVNHGEATHEHISGLAAEVTSAVRERYEIELTREPTEI